jgi:hypothetical protein
MPNSDEIVQHESTPPQPVLINPPVEASSISRQDHTEETEQSIVFIRAPKFKHPSRTVSSFAVVIALITFLFFFASAFAKSDLFLLETAIKSCCVILNIAFVSEVVFYSHLFQHNKETRKSNFSTVFNIVLFVVFTIAGVALFIGNSSF